jgi:hypothetical protein
MAPYPARHIALPCLVLALALASACASSRPAVRLLGVTDNSKTHIHRTLLVFLEVRNPTKRPLQLSTLEYTLRAQPWFAAEGRLSMARRISAGGSAVIEIPVRVDRPAPTARDEVPFQLDGTLSARSGDIETRWAVRASGDLAPEPSAVDGPSAHLIAPAARSRFAP